MVFFERISRVSLTISQSKFLFFPLSEESKLSNKSLLFALLISVIASPLPSIGFLLRPLLSTDCLPQDVFQERAQFFSLASFQSAFRQTCDSADRLASQHKIVYSYMTQLNGEMSECLEVHSVVIRYLTSRN